MKYTDFIYLNVPAHLKIRENPYGDEARERKVAAICTATEINFLKVASLLKLDSAAWNTSLVETVLRLSDFTEEGQDFIMSGSTDRWLGACDRKSNDMLKRGASEEERLAVYADPKGLYQRLEKFRKNRLAKSH